MQIKGSSQFSQNATPEPCPEHVLINSLINSSLLLDEFKFPSHRFWSIRRGQVVKTQLSLYPIYYAGDMFRPLWAILRSQKYIVKKAIQYKSINCGNV